MSVNIERLNRLLRNYVSNEVCEAPGQMLRVVYTDDAGFSRETEISFHDIRNIEYTGNSVDIQNHVCFKVTSNKDDIVYRYHVSLLDLIAFVYDKAVIQ